MGLTLDSVADVRQGVTLRTGLEADPKALVGIIQSKNIAGDGNLDLDTITKANIDYSPRHRLTQGDIVLQPRGSSFPAALFRMQTENLIVAAPLYLMTIKPYMTNQIDAEFLVFFLNYNKTQAHLKRIASGTHIPQLSRRDILALEIPSINVVKQRRVVQAYKLLNERLMLETEIFSLSSSLLFTKNCSTEKAK